MKILVAAATTAMLLFAAPVVAPSTAEAHWAGKYHNWKHRHHHRKWAKHHRGWRRHHHGRFYVKFRGRGRAGSWPCNCWAPWYDSSSVLGGDASPNN